MTNRVNTINYTEMVQLSIEELEMVTGGARNIQTGKRPVRRGPIFASTDDLYTGNEKYLSD